MLIALGIDNVEATRRREDVMGKVAIDIRLSEPQGYSSWGSRVADLHLIKRGGRHNEG